MATSVNWPVGVGGKGNEGVAGLVKQTPGSIGYVELIYALQNKIAYGSVQNKAGEFVAASLESVTAAAAAAAKRDADGLPGLDHECAGQGRLSDLVVHVAAPLREPQGQDEAPKIMVDFMKWALTDGQKYAPRARLRALARERRRARDGGAEEDQALSRFRGPAMTKTPSSRRSADDRGSGWGRGSSRCSSSCSSPGSSASSTGTRSSRSRSSASISGATKTWDPVAGEFGALPFIWGTLYSSILALLHLDAGRSRHRDLPLGALAAAAADAARVPDGAARGDPLDRLRPLGDLRARAGRAQARGPDARLAARRFRSSRVLRSASACCAAGADPRGHGHPLHLLRRARGPEGGAVDAARGRLRAGRDALGGDPGGAALRPDGILGAVMLGLRPRHRRDDGGDDGDRQQPAGRLRRSSRRSTRWPRHRQRVHRGGRRPLPVRARSRSVSCSS